jgi:hypothetical protein
MAPISLLTGNLDLRALIPEIDRSGAASVPIIDDATRLKLLQEAQSFTYTPQTEYLPNGVREQLASYYDFPESSQCATLVRHIETILNDQAAACDPHPFSGPLVFNEIVLQRYEKDSIGITPHRDFARAIVLIGVIVLEGIGRFCTCDDRAGNGAREIPAEPGRLILMRAPGFLGSDFRPMHFLDRIISQRYTLGMRCMADKLTNM